MSKVDVYEYLMEWTLNTHVIFHQQANAALEQFLEDRNNGSKFCAVVMLQCALEAFLNHILSENQLDYENSKWRNTEEKVKFILGTKGVSADFTKLPLRDIKTLRKWRNGLVHAKPEIQRRIITAPHSGVPKKQSTPIERMISVGMLRKVFKRLCPYLSISTRIVSICR